MQLTNNLALKEFNVSTKEVATIANLHHIWILDRSGSMGSTLKEVIRDLKSQCRKLKSGDALSFGWFSSKGMYGFPIKAFKITEDKECFNQLDKLFDQNSTVIGMTNFSEILSETIKLTQEVDFLTMRTSLLFFSDGYANDPSVNSEYTSVREIMPKLGKTLDNFLAIAHSNYADREFLSEMAELSGGESVSSQSFEQITRLIDKYLRLTETLQPRQVVDISEVKDKNCIGFLSLVQDSLNLHKPDENNLILSSNPVYALYENDGELTPVSLSLYYATSLMLSKKGKVNMALEVLNRIGDKYLIDRLNNAFTPSERGMVEDELLLAINNDKERFKDGAVKNYLPDRNAFCLLDLIDILLSDEETYFYPRHPEFKYNSIGLPSKQKEGYSKFNSYLENKSPLAGFSWNNELLNFSLLTTIKGAVNLPSEFKTPEEVLSKPLSLGNTIDTYQFRNYTLIKDGFLNITNLPLSTSSNTFELLKRNNIIDSSEVFKENQVYILDLTKIPVVNRAIGDLSLSAKEILLDNFNELKIQARLKVLNSLRKELFPDAPKTTNQWTEQERRYLIQCGFKDDGSYSPPVDLMESTDEYDAVSFKLQFKGLSTIPSLKDLRERLIKLNEYKANPSGKEVKLLLGMKLMVDEFIKFESVKDNQLDYLNNTIIQLKKELRILRNSIQRKKFSLVLGKNWFTDLEKSEAEQEVLINTELGELIGIIKVGRKVIKI